MALAGDVVRVAVRAAQHALGRRQKVVAAQGAGKVHDASMCDGQRLFHCCERYLISRGSRRAGARRQVSLGAIAQLESAARSRATQRLRGRTRRPDISMRRGTHALSGATKAHGCASPRDAFCEICGTRSRFNSVLYILYSRPMYISETISCHIAPYRIVDMREMQFKPGISTHAHMHMCMLCM